ncbi:transposase [Rhodococcus sp. WS3]|uniref:transposase n=1 Tax=unclassified Rhodococcus (in: high G+C Gram-positive bacteria) TaxID=192944 RepID=UPI0005EA12F1|nr:MULTISPECIES: transposase [unclassified Rhodococcus (in: high G+C Gram-positive bacteria)]KJF19200.1 hypothetical protein SZ00_06127 [Rhodococcus sp. AD45]ROZ42818.1 transposase [Rhodococcus sp. WS3]RZL20886.1 MAG: transposase [Rhodococcus sp. (in: high G+C Gram-positive bacteria)]
MTKKKYTEEFRRDAVELYRETDGTTVAGIAAQSDAALHLASAQPISAYPTPP